MNDVSWALVATHAAFIVACGWILYEVHSLRPHARAILGLLKRGKPR